MRNRSVMWGLVGIVLAIPAMAQQIAPAAGLYQFNIPAEPLGDALSQLAQQAGLQVMISSKLAEDLRSRELPGTYSADEALQRLLANTGLQFTFVNPRTVTIHTVGPSSKPQPSNELRNSSGSDAPTDVSETKNNVTDGGMKMQNQNSGLFARLLGLFAICSSVTHTGTVCAQEGGAEAESIALDEVVVTAQRREERLKDVPITIAALSDDQLEKSGVTNIFDLQNVVSGLTYSGVGNSTQPSIRGLNTLVSTNGSENPNALYVDGVYYATNQLFGANLPDVARIEVLKGPQGTLFGRNSTGGAIRIFTKDPTFSPTGDITVDAGYYTGDGTSRSSPHIAFRGFASAPIVDDVMAVSFSAGYDSTDGFLTNDANGEKFGQIKRNNARAKLLIQPNDSLRAVLAAYYLKHDDTGLQSATPENGLVVATGVSTVTGLPLYPGSIVPSLPYHTAFDSGLGLDINVADVESYGFSGHLQYELGDLGTLSSITAWNTNEVTNLTTFDHSKNIPSCMSSGVCLDYSYFFKLRALSQELNFSSRQMGMFRATAGLFYYHQSSVTDSYRQAASFPGGLFIRSDYFKIDSYAAYGEVEMQPLEPLFLTLGGRYTREPHDDFTFTPALASVGGLAKKETFNSFVPRFTARYVFTPKLNAYISYAKGEKSGLSGIANGASVPQYARVKPEENDAYEVGMKFADSRFLFNLAAFYYDYKNKQEQGFTGSTVFLENAKSVRIYGLDMDTSVRLTDDFSVRAAGSWIPEAEYRDYNPAAGFGLERTAVGTFRQIGINATGRRLAKAPEVTANLSLDYEHELAKGAVDANVSANYSSKVYHDLNQIIVQDAYTTLNARVGYKFDSGLHTSLYCRNVTNKAYISSGFSSAQGYTVSYARPREIGLSIKFPY